MDKPASAYVNIDHGIAGNGCSGRECREADLIRVAGRPEGRSSADGGDGHCHGLYGDDLVPFFSSFLLSLPVPSHFLDLGSPPLFQVANSPLSPTPAPPNFPAARHRCWGASNQPNATLQQPYQQLTHTTPYYCTHYLRLHRGTSPFGTSLSLFLSSPCLLLLQPLHL